MGVIVAASRFRMFLNEPTRVFFVCFVLGFLYLTFNGNFFRLWGLHRDVERLQTEILLAQKAGSHLDTQLKQAKDPVFIERQARDRLDLASEHDLVFVFADQ
ncbi:MAG: septum formation initiator family protein [Bdellovibrionia bacterium]